ncbi:MAG TPA: MerR family transcriptional regulator [Firmicutes bacterium]|nr:MerR family transcriptional regulator [Bacillota bacterium]
MGLKNCEKCGKAYSGSHAIYCDDCLEAEEEEFKIVRDFIKDNPKIAISVVSEATGVDEDKIRGYLRAGRLDVADLSGPVLSCSRCGKPIYRGQYCVLCQSEIVGGLKDAGGRRNESDDDSQNRESFLERQRNRKY